MIAPGNIAFHSGTPISNSMGTVVHAARKNPSIEIAEVPVKVAAASVAASGPGLVDRILGWGNTIVGFGSGLTMMVVPPVLSGAGGLLKKTNWKPLVKTGDVLQKPNRFLTEVSVADLGNNTVGTAVAEKTQSVAETIAKKADASKSVSRFGKWRAESYARQGNKALGSLKAHAPGLLDAAPEFVRPHFEEIHNIINNTSHIGGLKPAEVGKLQGALEAAATAMKENTSDAAQKLSKTAAKSWSQVSHSAENLIYHHNNITDFKNIGSAIRKAPAAMGKVKVGTAIFNSSLVGVSALSMFGSSRSFLQNVESLRQMYTDMTGKKISTIGILTASLPKPMAQARSSLFKGFGIESTMQAAFLAFNVKQLLGGRLNRAGMAVQFGMVPVGMAAMAMAGTSVVPVYKSFSDAYKRGEIIPLEAYAAFVGAASSDLQARGGAESPFAQELAKQYAAEKTSPAFILKEIGNGQLLKRIQGVITAHESHASQVAVKGKHVENLNGSRERPVVGEGKFTAKANETAHVEVGR